MFKIHRFFIPKTPSLLRLTHDLILIRLVSAGFLRSKIILKKLEWPQKVKKEMFVFLLLVFLSNRDKLKK